MRKLAFACVLLCSLGSIDVLGMNPNQFPQTENIADQNNPVGEIGLNPTEVNDHGDTETIYFQRRKVAVLCAATGSVFFCTSLLLAVAASFSTYRHHVNPTDNLKKMTETILAFTGVGSSIEAALSYIPATNFRHLGLSISTLLSLVVPTIEIASMSHGKNSVINRSSIDNVELFLVSWLSYAFAALGGVSLFNSLRLFRRR